MKLYVRISSKVHQVGFVWLRFMQREDVKIPYDGSSFFKY